MNDASRKHVFKILSYKADDVRWARRAIQCAVNPASRNLQREYNQALVRFGEEVMRVRMMEAAIFVSGGRWVK